MVDTFDYNDPKIFERALIEHRDKYEKAVQAKDGGQACYHLGAMKSMEQRLREFGYTEDQIQKVKEGKQDNEEK